MENIREIIVDTPKMKKEMPMLKTIRPNGEMVGREVSRQRRWQIRNPEKARKILERCRKSEKGKEYQRKYNQAYRQRPEIKEKYRKYNLTYYYKHRKEILKNFGKKEMPKPKQKIKAWAMKFNKKESGLNELCVLEPEPDLDGNKYRVKCKCKLHKKLGFHYIDSLAIFERKKEAECWRENNKDFETVPVEICLLKNNKKPISNLRGI